MAKFKPQFRRILMIDRELRKGTCPNCSQLAENREAEVNEKTIRRDIAYMRDELGSPIDYDARRRGFYYTEAQYRLPAIDIKESDLFAICIAEKALKQYENTPVYGRLQSIFEKIEQSLPEKVSVRPSWLDAKVSIFMDSTTKIDPSIWETAFTALRESKTLKILHQVPGYDQPALREVDPYHIVNYQGEWYVIGFCHDREQILTFAISRIRGAELLESTFHIPPDFDFNTFMGKHFGIHRSEKEYTVRIRFSAHDAPYVKERSWHPTQVIKENRDGSVILSFRTNHLYGVKRWIMSWGVGALVLTPKELREEVTKELKTSLKNYKRKTPTAL